MKLLMWLVLAALVVLAIRKKSQQQPGAGQDGGAFTAGHPSNPANMAQASAQNAEAMVCCETCQIHFPASEAVYREQHVYCSVAHADQHA
ncbi:PP0621 family protein [Undibacterium sp. Xuan67W]|uniref:PP0621 family protein n=1 Tax=Undibacterium sp. Xuan67W TaxID=3413057 RepID=UPI003BF17F2F